MIEIEVDYGNLDKEVDQAIKETINEVALKMAAMGESYIAESREKGSYTDRTGNLRNANSYAVFYDGKELFSSYGHPDTEKFFNEVKSPSGLELIVGNGMEYCSYVEAKGYDVVSSGFLTVMNEVWQD